MTRPGSATFEIEREVKTTPVEPEPVLTWLGIELQDADGASIKEEAYEVEHPDGTVAKGSLDEYGQVLLDEIPEGEYRVTFPELEPDDISLVDLDLQEDTRKAWIEVVLQDDAGQPLVGVTGEIQLPDGTVETRKTDSQGYIRIEGTYSGVCWVRFPAYDPETLMRSTTTTE